VLGIVGALFCVPNSPADPPRRLEPRWIGLVLLGAAVVCYAWGRRARPTAPASPPAGADPIGTQEPFPRRE